LNTRALLQCAIALRHTPPSENQRGISSPEGMVYSLTYVSSAVVPFTTQALRDLLSQCCKHNERDGITGMLLYKDGNFMQVLEGEESMVRSAHLRIHSDPRHRGLITMLKDPIAERQFPQSPMGFRDLSANARASSDGYGDFLNTPLPDYPRDAPPSRVMRLLWTFKESM
jgi:hypothetical protein